MLAALVTTPDESPAASLAEALALDPALSLWGVLHFAARAPADASKPFSLAALAAWLVERLPQLVEPAVAANGSLVAKSREPAAAAPSAVASIDPADLAELAASNVNEAESAVAAEEWATNPCYLQALLRNTVDWLRLAGCPPNEGTKLPAWLADAAATPPGTEGPRAALARLRWQLPASYASQQFSQLAARLGRMRKIETRFADKLEEEKLEALAEFAAGAGHEINNPLAVISGRVQLFLRHEHDPGRRRELAIINTQARRVYEMIADLMLFARPPQPTLADCRVSQLVESVAAELAPRAAAAGIALSVSAPADLPTLRADLTQLQVALRAVCDNALAAVAAGGHVEIAAARRRAVAPGAEPWVAIEVRDDGPGIAPEVRRHAFDPFYSGYGAGRGLGNGLAKCWRIVTAHGGRVEIENRPTQGACVTLLLPERSAAAVPQGAPALAPS